jgi:hypothetical protein
MKICKTLFMVLSFPCIFGVSNATAAALGFYGTGGLGTADWTVDSGSSSSTNFRKNTNHLGAGLAMDTVPARDNLFNYHLNIGYDRFSTRGGGAWGNSDFEGILLSNNFGFGTLINPRTRVWFGPEIRLEWANGSPKQYPSFKIRLFGVGIGPVIGVNFNIGDKYTFVVKAGFQYLNYFGEGEGNYSHATNSPSINSNRYDYDVTEKLFYVNLEFLFRTSGDR